MSSWSFPSSSSMVGHSTLDKTCIVPRLPVHAVLGRAKDFALPALPTVERSTAVLVGIQDRLRALLGGRKGVHQPCDTLCYAVQLLVSSSPGKLMCLAD